MKIFLDTNIFLDLLLNRKECDSAKEIFNAIQNEIFEAYVADITLLNIDYIAKKQTTDIRKFLSYVSDNFNIMGASNRDFENALKIDNADLEDNIQYLLAKKVSCDLIVSNDRSFLQEDIKVVQSDTFVAHYVL